MAASLSIFASILNFMLAVPKGDPRHNAAKRLALVRVFALLCFVGIATQVLVLAGGEEDVPVVTPTLEVAGRGKILDRNGHILATDLPAIELSANPSEILDPHQAATKLARVLTDRGADELYGLLTRDSRYVELAWRLPPAKYSEVLALGIPGLYGRRRLARAYPNGEAAAHVLGAVDKDMGGIAGIEFGMNHLLRRGHDVRLSIDLHVQAILRQEMLAQLAAFDAIGGAAVLLDINTGEIIAMLSLPDYDANHFHATRDNHRFNRATKGVYELGSGFKVLNTAIALETNQFQSGDMIDVVSALTIGSYSISDYHPEEAPLNLAEVLVVSSNKGAARVARVIGGEAQRYYLTLLGMLDPLSLEIPELGTPLLPSRWEEAEVMTIAYGHGISVTPVHLVSAIASASQGLTLSPSLLQRSAAEHNAENNADNDYIYDDYNIEVFSPATTRQIRAIMRQVVSHPEGTANLAETKHSKGYLVAGKTGTAEKVNGDAGGYDKRANLTSFVGIFPAHAPRYALLTMIDEPKPQTPSQIHISGGQVAAPVAGRIIERVAPILGVATVDASAPEIQHALRVALPRLDAKLEEKETQKQARLVKGENHAAF